MSDSPKNLGLLPPALRPGTWENTVVVSAPLILHKFSRPVSLTSDLVATATPRNLGVLPPVVVAREKITDLTKALEGGADIPGSRPGIIAKARQELYGDLQLDEDGNPIVEESMADIIARVKDRITQTLLMRMSQFVGQPFTDSLKEEITKAAAGVTYGVWTSDVSFPLSFTIKVE